MCDEWADADDPVLRKLCGYGLRPHVRYQDGRDSLAPSLVFADADYEVGDGTCGLHSDGKQANEPAIVYARADALIDATARIEALETALQRTEAKLTKAREALTFISETVSWEINPSNYDHQNVCDMNTSWGEIGNLSDDTLAALDADTPAPEVTVGEAARQIMRDSAARDTAFDAMWSVAQKHSLEATSSGGARYSITGDIVNELYYATLRALTGEKGNDNDEHL